MKTRKTNTKKRVLDGATRLIHTKGFRATSVGEIISAAGIRKGGLYHHFLSKDQIGLEVLECMKRKFMEFLEETLSGNQPGEALEFFFNSVLLKHKEAGFVGGCIFGNMALEMADDNKIFAETTARVFSNWIQKIENVVHAAQENSQVRRDIPARLLAQHIVMAIEGGIMLSRLTKDETPLKECLELLRKMLQLQLSVNSGLNSQEKS
ncbi:MAG: TetR/AcrR family transcriptional regulator [Candidatus Latescibacter sp.]|nr:TetR/AcrR family transcriptional regulator [Candidatus Latescibacter sp.]